jgi:hypothetical protein
MLTSLILFLFGVYVGQEFANFPNVKNVVVCFHETWKSPTTVTNTFSSTLEHLLGKKDD